MEGGKKEILGSLELLKNEQFKRLAHKAGAKSISRLIFDDLRGVTKTFMDTILVHALNLMDQADHTKLSQEDVMEALKAKYKTLYSTNAEEDRKTCEVFKSTPNKKRATKKGTDSIRMIKFYQNQSDCVYFSKSGFEKLVKELIQNHKKDIMVSKKASGVLQFATEAFLVELLEATVLCGIHAGRETIKPNDLELARHIKGYKVLKT